MGTSNTQTEGNSDHHGGYIQQGTISTLKMDSHETPKIDLHNSKTESRVWESQDTVAGHQTKIQWDVTREVTQQIETAASEGREDSRPNSHVWIEGPGRSDVAADDEEKDCVTPTNSPCHWLSITYRPFLHFGGMYL